MQKQEVAYLTNEWLFLLMYALAVTVTVTAYA